MQIQIVNASKPEWKEGKVNAQTGKPSKYQTLILTYIAGGKTSTKNIMSFSPVFNAMKEAESGEQYEVTMVKEGDFWNWTKAEKQDSANGPSEASTPGISRPAQMSKPSTYETAEERAKKQVYIVKQSSLSNALEYSKSVKALKSKEEVLALAQEFVDFVFAAKQVDIENMEDDVPQ